MRRNKKKDFNAIMDYVKSRSSEPLYKIKPIDICNAVGIERCYFYRLVPGGVSHVAEAIVRHELGVLRFSLSALANGNTEAIQQRVNQFYDVCNANVIATAASILPDIHNMVREVLRARFTAAKSEEYIYLANAA